MLSLMNGVSINSLISMYVGVSRRCRHVGVGVGESCRRVGTSLRSAQRTPRQGRRFPTCRSRGRARGRALVPRTRRATPAQGHRRRALMDLWIGLL